MMTAETPEKLFSRICDRKSLYDAGTYILALSDEGLSEDQRDFKRCYDLWLGLGNGFSSVCNGTYLSSLPRGVAAFERIGLTKIATLGRLVLAEFESRNLQTTEDEISDFILDGAELDRFQAAIEKIDGDYMKQIWESADDIEQGLISLASGQPQQSNTEQVGAQNP
jgi:hypothetical protein